VARFQQPEHGAGSDERARSDGGPHRLVRGAQAVVVVDRHHAPAAHRPGEHDRAGARREHGLPCGAHEVDAPVAAPVRVRRWAEARGDRGSRQERPRVPRSGGRVPRARGRHRWHLPHERLIRARHGCGGRGAEDGRGRPRCARAVGAGCVRGRDGLAHEGEDHHDPEHAGRSTARRPRSEGRVPVHGSRVAGRGRIGGRLIEAVDGCGARWTTGGTRRRGAPAPGVHSICTSTALR
jgi:hypothetical protein